MFGVFWTPPSPGGDLGTLGRRAYFFVATAVLGLLYAYVAKGGLPAEFFTFAVRPSRVAHVLLTGDELGDDPGLHGFLSHALEFLGQSKFGIIFT